MARDSHAGLRAKFYRAKRLLSWHIRGVIKRILVRCPITKKLNVTGITVDEDLFEDAKLKPKDVSCAHCGGTHSWNKKQAILAR